MRRSPTLREQALLKAMTLAGGYRCDVPTEDEVRSCVAKGWLLPDGPRRYGITVAGRLAVKPHWH
jgi:hypothetical protein